MPSRRAHTKSRNGCDVCRSRRIRCPEDGPPCSKCNTRRLLCTYNKRDKVAHINSVNHSSTTTTQPQLNGNGHTPQPSALRGFTNGTTTANSSTTNNTHSPHPSSTSTSTPPTTSPITSTPPTIPLTTSPPTHPLTPRLTELALMRQWCLHSCHSLVRKNTSDVQIWLGEVTNIGLEFPFVMDVIFAVSATHIAAGCAAATTTTTKSSELVERRRDGEVRGGPRDAVKAKEMVVRRQRQAEYTALALEYQNRAVQGARPYLGDVNEGNCDALFAFTILNIPVSIVLAQLPVGLGDGGEEEEEEEEEEGEGAKHGGGGVVGERSNGLGGGRSPVESILISSEWIQCLTSLMMAGEVWLRQGPFHLAYDKCDEPSCYDESLKPAMGRLGRLLMQSKYVGREYTGEFEMFSRGVESLEGFFLRAKNMAIGWPAEMGSGFIKEVQEGNRMALMLTMHWGVLLHELDMWWGSFTGKRLVEQISRELGVWGTKDGDEAVRWARVMVELDMQKT